MRVEYTYNFNHYNKLYLRCILKNCNYAFLDNASLENFKSENLLLSSTALYYFTLHLKLSSLFYTAQLTDIFSYEVPRPSPCPTDYTPSSTPSNMAKTKFSLSNKSLSSPVVYNFHLLNSQVRFYVFVTLPLMSFTHLGAINHSSRFSGLNSITDLFFAANWLERETSELNGVTFTNKKDLRNLMLQYGDASAPFQKSFPSIGLKEMYYNPIKDTIIQNPVSIQI